MRILKIVVMALMLFVAHTLGVAIAKEKKVKVGFFIPDVGQGESLSVYLGAQMDLLDQADDSYKLEWAQKADAADFIITVLGDKNPYPVMIEDGSPPKTCHQYLLITQLWKRGSDMSHDGMNVQLDCDPNEAAKRAAKAMEKAMGLKPEIASK